MRRRFNAIEMLCEVIDEDDHVVGMLDTRSIRIRLTEEVVRRREA